MIVTKLFRVRIRFPRVISTRIVHTVDNNSTKMYILHVVTVFISLSHYTSAYLTQKQEEDAVNYMNYEIQKHEVKDEDSLGQLVEKMATMMLPYLPYGIQAWEIPSLDPFYLKTVKVLEPAGGTMFRANFKDVLVYGLNTFKIKSIQVHPKSYSFDAIVRFPSIKVLGLYNIDGRLLMFQLKDHGPFSANITNFDAHVQANFEIVDGFLDLQGIEGDFKYSKFKFHLENLFKGSPVGEQVNKALNESIDDVINELRGGFMREIRKIIVKTLRGCLRNLPLTKWQAAI